MMINDEANSPRNNPRPQEFPNTICDSSKGVAIFTVLSILREMKSELGIEAMIEYLEGYLGLVERHNPNLHGAVKRGLQKVRVEKIYLDLMRNK